MVTAAEMASALDYRRNVRGMMDDPDLTGDVLLLALAMLDVIYREAETGGPSVKRSIWTTNVAKACGWRNVDKVRWVISADFPRYEPPDGGWNRSCLAPMLRRDGTCGQRGSAHGGFIYDPESGERQYAVACSRHRQWALAETRRTTAAWQANGEPEPPHNRGGVLSRYFGGDWSRVYRWANPWRKQTPGEGKPVTPPRPQFTLIRGDG